jgi:hypothetical protein
MELSLEKLTVAQLVNSLHFIQKLKVHYRVHKGPPLDPTLNQMNPAHVLKPNNLRPISRDSPIYA